MAVANVIITECKLTPNPIQTGRTFIISVKVEDRYFGIATAAGRMIKNANGAAIARKGG